MFGDRETAISADQRAYRVELNAFQTIAAGQVVAPMATITDAAPVAISRSDDATVATLSAGLGLSYSVGGFTAGAGYRWERYFDAIDGGFAEAKDADRTIDGPYFELSLGFGG